MLFYSCIELSSCLTYVVMVAVIAFYVINHITVFEVFSFIFNFGEYISEVVGRLMVNTHSVVFENLCRVSDVPLM